MAYGSDFVVSPNGRWVAVWSATPPGLPQAVTLVSTDGKTCLAVPRSSQQSDIPTGFTADSRNVIVSRSESFGSPDGVQRLAQFAISSLPAKSTCLTEG